MMRRLVYFTLGNNTAYLEVARLCVASLYATGYNGDILFITDMRSNIESVISSFWPHRVFFLEVGKSDLLHSAASKLRIFEFVLVSNYSHIIYCDLDILWLRSPELIFEKLLDDKVYITTESWRRMTHRYYAGNGLLDDTEIAQIEKDDTKGLNTGFFAFKSTMIHVIREIYYFFLKNIDKANEFLEQSFVNVYLHRNGLYDTSLTGMLAHNGRHITRTRTHFDGVALHFAGGPGNSAEKMLQMQRYMKALEQS